ncbi:MAG: ribosome silencing factor [Proteobacteria bacterium]|nr:ribosome silencing factor [Pseudomonadota bacterium]
MDIPFTLSKISQSASDLKAVDLVQIDMDGKSSLADYILVCHGTSTAHTKGIADKISLNLKKEGILPIGVEGYDSGEWILMDFNTVIIHIFLEETRETFNLEEIYQDFNTTHLE